MLGLAAAAGVLTSDLPRLPAWLLASTASFRGAWLAASHRRLPTHRLRWPATGPVMLDDQPIDAPRLHWRGPWLFLHWHYGRALRTLVWWPDTLDARTRRELRLRAGGHDLSRLPPSVAT
ncbi:MAG: hypothetical protein Q4F49_00985 [Pseudoxanthomonas suwonensis]|nr:hypothetical protein [Pseudoxanthomonas suwonensis]